MPAERFISKEELIRILTQHYYLKERTYFDIVIDLKVKNTETGKVPDMTINLERSIMGDKVSVQLPEDEIKGILKTYAQNHNESLYSYLYVGGVRRAGVHIDEDTPFFTGVMLYVKPITKKQDRCLQKK